MKIDKDTVVWITGASSGIGEALAYHLSAKGASLILSARRENELDRVRTGCASPEKALTLPLDLENTKDFKEKVEIALTFKGKIDILINNGGIGHLGSVLEMTEAVERKVMQINFWGQVALTREVLPHFQKRGKGQIVAISSLLGWFGSPKLAAYAASKAALKGYFDSLREEIREQGIQILVAFPGFIDTQVTLQSLGPDGQPIQKNSVAQENGMDPNLFAKKLTHKIEKGSWFATIGGYERFSIPFYKWMPVLFYKTMAYLSAKARKN